MARKNVKVIDRGWNKLVKDFKLYKRGISASVGVQGAQAQGYTGDHGGLTNVQIGAAHEFGRGVPQRSHWRRGFDENRRSYEVGLSRIAGSVYDGNSAFVKGELLLLGEIYKHDVIKLLHSGTLRKLSRQTVRRKKGDATTLVDTGEYKGSFSVLVVEGGIL